MSICTIKAGSHYHRLPPFTTLPWIGEQRIERYVTFAESCQYDVADYNADDVNKLFGLSFGLRGVHHNSARFGWRWSKSEQCIELLAYYYVNGQRNWDEQVRFPVVARVELGERVKLSVSYATSGNKAAYYFTVAARDFSGLQISRTVMVDAPVNLPSYGLTHGPYFGGDLTAPHEMTIKLERL